MKHLNMAGTLGPALKRVLDFHRSAGFSVQPFPRLPDFETHELALRLIQEETNELEEVIDEACLYQDEEARERAAREGVDVSPDSIPVDMTKIAHELTDLLYVVLGCAVRFGIDLSPCFDAVADANDSKIGPSGPRFREDGKLLKSADFKAANLAPIIAHQTELAKIGEPS